MSRALRHLLVEDEDGVRDALISFLALRGHCTAGAADCAEARRIAAGGIDALIADHDLPDGEGSALAAELLAAGRVRRVLLISARPPQDFGRLFRGRPAACLVKPASPGEILSWLEGAGEPAAAGGRTALRARLAEAGLDQGTLEAVLRYAATIPDGVENYELVDEGPRWRLVLRAGAHGPRESVSPPIECWIVENDDGTRALHCLLPKAGGATVCGTPGTNTEARERALLWRIWDRER